MASQGMQNYFVPQAAPSSFPVGNNPQGMNQFNQFTQISTNFSANMGQNVPNNSYGGGNMPANMPSHGNYQNYNGMNNF